MTSIGSVQQSDLDTSSMAFAGGIDKRGMDLSRRESPVWSCNEWDPLEEVIVGHVNAATVPTWGDASLRATTPDHAKWFFEKHGGSSFPEDMIAKANEELDGLATAMQDMGITVRRPDPFPFGTEYQTPWWKSRGLYAAMPRDVLLTVGDILIEAPMAWRTRYFEGYAYRTLLMEYFERGARWLSAPKPSMDDAFYCSDYNPDEPEIDGIRRFVISEREIAFDAADFVRLGRDIVVQKSNVTNAAGIEWVRRHIGSDFRVHVAQFGDTNPMHIDTTIVPLAQGKLLINPLWVTKLPPVFDGWEIRPAPPPVMPEDNALYFSSDWLTMNMLSIDEKRVIVEETEEPLLRMLEAWGFEPIPLPFRNFYPFGGSFHCATADIRRRGSFKE
jgi:glycine amidinotransferase